MKHARLLLISGIIAIILYCLLCFVTVFSVTDVKIEYTVYSSEDLQIAEEILSSYKGKNIFFIDEQEVANKIIENTSLKVSSVEKLYPFTLTAKVFAREERFAILKEDGYYILDDEFTVLKKREDYINPDDNLTDILVEFNTKDQPDLTVKSPLVMENTVLFNALKDTVSCFESPRDIIQTITLLETQEAGNYRIILTLRSGVKIQIFKASVKTVEKTALGIQKYYTLQDSDLLNGLIECYEKDNGQVVAVYTRIIPEG